MEPPHLSLFPFTEDEMRKVFQTNKAELQGNGTVNNLNKEGSGFSLCSLHGKVVPFKRETKDLRLQSETIDGMLYVVEPTYSFVCCTDCGYVLNLERSGLDCSSSIYIPGLVPYDNDIKADVDLSSIDLVDFFQVPVSEF